MATQGLVTIRVGGQVKMKIVAGSNGMKAESLAISIRRLGRVPEIDEAYTLAVKHKFGTDGCLVVMTRRQVRYEGEERLNRLYRRTFNDPNFNPRWKFGTADHVKVIDLKD